VPGNLNLESVDPLERDLRHLTLGDRPIRLAEPLKAALITSLGFGHVSAVLAIAHPDTFLASVDATQRDGYLTRAGRRRAEGVQRRLDAHLGHPPTVRRPNPPRTRDEEAADLLKEA
jgi:fatty acid synthase